MKVLITDAVHPLLAAGLTQRGYQVTYLPAITFTETLAMIEPYTGLVVNSKIYCGSELLAQAPHLKWIARLGSGMEVIDTLACEAKGVQYFNTPEGNCDAVGEHALGLLLSLLRNIAAAHRQIVQGEWHRELNRGHSLNGKTVGIIGFGHTGQALANVLQGFDVRILAHDKYQPIPAMPKVIAATQAEIQQQADIISFHLPLTSETTHYANATFFEQCVKDVIVINTSRGAVMDTEALLKSLQTGKIKMAGLDVYENERAEAMLTDPQWLELRKQQQVILTPHIAGWTHESKQKLAEMVLTKLDSCSI
ncbi:MAG: NAD(P)-dependent oxidoreductase [Chitinophagales bacterium]